jgi:diguanylate cyclase
MVLAVTSFHSTGAKMNRLGIRLLLFIVSFALTIGGVFADPLDVNSIKSGDLLGQHSLYLADDEGTLTIEQLPEATDERWQPVTQDILSLGYTSTTVWNRLAFTNTGEETEWMFEVAYSVLDKVDFYILYPNRTQVYKLGDLVKFDERPINHRNFVVPLSLPIGETVVVMVRVSSSTSMQMPLKLWQRTDFYDHEQGTLLWQGMYFGLILVMIFYKTCLYYYIKEEQYLNYAASFTSLVLFQATISGFSYQFLWPQLPLWNDHALPIFLGLLLLTESIFVRSLLGLSARSPRVSKFLRVSEKLAALAMVVSIFVPYRFSIFFLIVLALLINSFCLAVGVKQWLEGDKAAKFFTIAWVGILVGAVLLALSKLGIIERNVFNENALQIGTTLSVVWLSFALGEYIAKQSRERQRSKEEALGFALNVAEERKGKLEAQEETLKLQEAANANLESQVQERTSMLEKTMLELEQANAKLRQLSYIDELTDIYNRRYFNKKLETEFKRAQRIQAPLSLLLLDIDHFKLLNDKYGHLVGDACLKAVAKVFQSCLPRAEDTLARFGGEEFVILLPGTAEEGALSVAERILQAVANEVVFFEDLEVTMTVSIGVATKCPSSTDYPKELIARADVALYQSKSNGRNCISVA